MNLLLDTHVLLWAAASPGRLPSDAQLMLEDTSNTLVFSTASLWEIAIKSSLGRYDFQVDARRLREGLKANGYQELSINGEHTLATQTLPLIHRDPFDRMLVAQARVEGLVLMTADALVARYPATIHQITPR